MRVKVYKTRDRSLKINELAYVTDDSEGDPTKIPSDWKFVGYTEVVLYDENGMELPKEVGNVVD